MHRSFTHIADALFLTILAALVGGLAIPAAAADRPAGAVQEAQRAFDRKEFDRALALADALVQGPDAPQEAHRVKVRSLLRLGKPQDALKAYDRLEAKLGRDDVPLLREVALGFIVLLLKDMREQMRGAAYTALKEWESDETVPYLEEGLTDGSALVRALAVEGLGKVPAGRRSPALQRALEDQAALVRSAALKVLGQVGDRSAVPLVERALKDEQPSVRVAAAGALVLLGQGQGWERVQASASAANPEERGAALRMLGDLHDRRALPLLEQALADSQPSVRWAAVAALGDLGLPEAVPAVLRLLNDPIPAVRASTAISLGDLKTAEAGAGLARALADVNPVVRAAAASALLQRGVPLKEVEPTLRELAQNQDPGIRAAAARALTKCRTEDIADASAMLRLLAKDAIPRPRIAALRALGHLGGAAALPALKEALRDADEAVRATAAGAVGRVLHPPGPQSKTLKTQ